MTLLKKSFPPFSLTDQYEQTQKRSDFAGNWIVIFAYPKACTAGCTQEAKDFRDLVKKYAKLGCKIIGLSPDPAKRQLKFTEQNALPFPLLCDIEKDLLQKLKIWVEKSMYGRKYMGVDRSTFLVNPAGKVVAQWNKVSVTGHAETVLDKLRELQS